MISPAADRYIIETIDGSDFDLVCAITEIHDSVITPSGAEAERISSYAPAKIIDAFSTNQ